MVLKGLIHHKKTLPLPYKTSPNLGSIVTEHAWIFSNHKNELKYMNLSQIELIKKSKKS